MTVTRDIPTSTQKLSVSQPFLLANSQGYWDTWLVDHVSYADGNIGFHNKVTMPIQSVAPTGEASASQMYTIDSTTNAGRTDLYYRYQNNVGSPMRDEVFPLTCIKALGRADATAAGDRKITGTTFNIASMTWAPTSSVLGTWTVNFTSPISDDITKILPFVTILNTASSSSYNLTTQVISTSQVTVRISASAAASSTSLNFMALAFG